MRDQFTATLRLVFFPEYKGKVTAMRTVLHAIALALTTLILPGLTVSEVAGSRVVGFVILAVIFGVLNAVIKPIVQLLTLPFILTSYGVVILLINVAILAILDGVAPELIQVDNAWSVFVGGALIGLFGIVLENLFGTTRPIVDDEDESEEARQ